MKEVKMNSQMEQMGNIKIMEVMKVLQEIIIMVAKMMNVTH